MTRGASKDGRWAASIDLGYRWGKHRKHVLGWTRAAVVDKFNDALAQHKKGIDIDPARVTVGEWAALG